MFALEIQFTDGVTSPEMLFVRRPQAVIGASDYAHVVIEDMKTLDYQIRVAKGVGRQFRCQPVGGNVSPEIAGVLDAVYDGEASLDLGVVKLNFTSLDSDLLVKDNEPPDRAGVRVLRQSCAFASPLFPAVVVCGAQPVVVSFIPDQPLYIGRSKRCALRLDSSDISAEHARMGFESGEFWIEDLGSTNGTFVDRQQVSGRQTVQAGTQIVLGREITLRGVISESQLQQASDSKVSTPLVKEDSTYPVVISTSELVRPARLVIHPGSNLVIGRDPSSDIWVGAPHISRKHCTLNMLKTGALAITDHSRNGVAFDGGMLTREQALDISDAPRVFDFGGGVNLAICFSQEQEKVFHDSEGAFTAFTSGSSATPERTELGAIAGLKAWDDESSNSKALSMPSLKQSRSGIARNILQEFGSLGKRGKLGVIAFFLCVVILVLFLVPLVMSIFEGFV